MAKETTIQKENKMGVMPVNRLLISMSVPMMISMLVQALYNIVDSMFVAQISENALTAVSLAFPAQNLMIAVATGTGVGINALLSKSLGEKNFDRVNKTAGNAVFLAFCSFVVFALLGGFFSRLFLLCRPTLKKSSITVSSISSSVPCSPSAYSGRSPLNGCSNPRVKPFTP